MSTTASDGTATAFGEEGYFVVPALFSEGECAEIVTEVERAAFELNLGQAEDGQLVYRPMMCLVNPALEAVATDPRWAPIVLPLLGEGNGARLYWEQAVCKPPHARTELPWHQDNGYTPLDPEEYVTCWLALDDTTVDNGCIWVVPGSHRSGTLPHHNDPDSPFRVGATPSTEGVPVPVRRGDVLVFSSLILHRSGPNETDRERRAWIIQYCATDARSALSGRVLDDRLQVADNSGWMANPVRQREFDLLGVLANYDQRSPDTGPHRGR